MHAGELGWQAGVKKNADVRRELLHVRSLQLVILCRPNENCMKPSAEAPKLGRSYIGIITSVCN
jgi:hypothetical protein